jgi:hypothetical protein
MTTWRRFVLYALLASFIGVAYTIPISGLLGGWEQLNQRHFWGEKACLFGGAFPGLFSSFTWFHLTERNRKRQ